MDINDKLALPPGTLLGQYKILKELGRGGFGITYLSYDNELKRQVVLKENFPSGICRRVPQTGEITPINDSFLNTYQFCIAQALQEAQTIASLEHPNIVSIYSFFQSSGSVYYVMPYLSGGSLRELLDTDDSKLNDPARITAILYQILSGLKFLHDKGLTHRDIKPSNIMFKEDFTPVLIDFGSSKHSNSANDMTTTVGSFSHLYASPEQVSGKGGVGPQSDLYALGASLYEIITGQRLESADKRLLEDSYSSLLQDTGNVQKWGEPILKLLDLCLILRPNDRIQSTDACLEILSGAKRPLTLKKPTKTTKKQIIIGAIALSVLTCSTYLLLNQHTPSPTSNTTQPSKDKNPIFPVTPPQDSYPNQISMMSEDDIATLTQKYKKQIADTIPAIPLFFAKTTAEEEEMKQLTHDFNNKHANAHKKPSIEMGNIIREEGRGIQKQIDQKNNLIKDLTRKIETQIDNLDLKPSSPIKQAAFERAKIETMRSINRIQSDIDTHGIMFSSDISDTLSKHTSSKLINIDLPKTEEDAKRSPLPPLGESTQEEEEEKRADSEPIENLEEKNKELKSDERIYYGEADPFA